MYIIEDEIHAELLKKEYKTFEEALSALERIASISWDEEPNRCPCTNWKECERNYHIVEYDTSGTYWKELQRWDMLTISAKGTRWTKERIL